MTEAVPTPAQREIPLAMLNGEEITQLPDGLYIPPDALEVFLDEFEGPLDLLLYLIRRQNLDILDLPVAKITDQYLQYIALMNELQLELASEYLVMAALLAEIKSRSLLPLPPSDDDEEDLREELIRRLQEYERFKNAANELDQVPRLERDMFDFTLEAAELEIPRPLPRVDVHELLMALQSMELRVQFNQAHQIETETLSVRDRMSQVMERVTQDSDCAFHQLYSLEEGNMGVGVTLLALLELLALNLIVCEQEENYGPIRIRRQVGAEPPQEVASHV